MRHSVAESGQTAAHNPSPRRSVLRACLSAILLASVTFFAYQPAWRGGFLWDDDMHVTRPELRSLQGLGRIWFEAGATPQYYPLTHSAFWLQYRLFADRPFGYHLVNIALHVLSANLVAGILLVLRVPGAGLAAAVFALHPVHVESVAWITELKNTLSGVFYFGAVWAYLGFDESRRRRLYALASGLFVLGQENTHPGGPACLASPERFAEAGRGPGGAKHETQPCRNRAEAAPRLERRLLSGGSRIVWTGLTRQR